MTAAEKKLWHSCLKNYGHTFLRQKPIDNYIIDFYCSELGLVIEIDGDSHLDEKNISYDIKRTKNLEKYGLKILRFWNDDMLNGIEIISEIIEKEINKLKQSPNPLCQGG
jgi:very-short-patch-repair endonuclease